MSISGKNKQQPSQIPIQKKRLIESTNEIRNRWQKLEEHKDSTLDYAISQIYKDCDIFDRLIDENKKLRELASLRDELLICYRIGKSPTDKLLDRLKELRLFEQALKGNP